MLILISIFHLGTKPSIRVVFHTYKSSRAEKPGVRHNAARNKNDASFVLSKSSEEKKKLKSLSSHSSVSPSVFWHYSDEFCIAVWVMFTDQSRSVKSRIIALLNSPGIPWHIVLVCSVQTGSLNSDRIFFTNKLQVNQYYALYVFSYHWKKKIITKITKIKFHIRSAL